jgi:Na+/H+ antiporter NhaA
MSDTPSTPPATDAPKRPFDSLQSILGNDLATLISRYGVVIVMIWQFVAGGIKDTMREVIHAEMAPMREALAKLESRVAQLEKKP